MNLWLGISLDEYEGHMALPYIGQAAMLADLLARAAEDYAPSSVGLFGCAGGNGLDRLDPAAVSRVVALDVNPIFVKSVSTRYGDRFERIEPLVHDLSAGMPTIEPVDMLFAGLLLEYLDWPEFVRDLRSVLVPGGVFACVLQMPSAHLPEVSCSPFRSLRQLEQGFRFVDPDALQREMKSLGTILDDATITLSSGKCFRFVAMRIFD